MHDRLKDIFTSGYTPSILTIAEEIRFYAAIRNNPEQDRQIASILRRHGYLPLNTGQTGFVPGRSIEEKEAYRMIARMIEAFESEEHTVQLENRALVP